MGLGQSSLSGFSAPGGKILPDGTFVPPPPTNERLERAVAKLEAQKKPRKKTSQQAKASGKPSAPSAPAAAPKSARDLAYEEAIAPDAWYQLPGYMLNLDEAIDALGPSDESTQAQQRALDELFGIYSQGGATAQDRARQAAIRRDQEQWLRGQREADMANFAERGMGGSGMELLSLLGDRQAAASRISQNDLDTEAMHEQRAMDALLSGSELAGSMRKSSFDESAAKADLISTVAMDNTDWFRSNYERIKKQEFDAEQANKKLGFDAAEGLYGFDQDDDQFKYGSASDQASRDASRYNDANQQSAGALTGQDPEGAEAGALGGRNAGISGGAQNMEEGHYNVHAGAGQAGDGFMQLFGAGGGGMPGGGGQAKSGGGGFYDDQNRKMRGY